MHFTGEPYQLAFEGLARLLDGEMSIPDAQSAAQQRVESAILHRLLHGRGDGQSLHIRTACPTAEGLRLVVPPGQAAAFGTALAMRPDQAAADVISIRCKSPSTLLLTASEPENGVILQCSWKDLRESVAEDPYVSAPSLSVLRFGIRRHAELTRDERATLSGLLRRIALFTKPGALDWLVAWHEWLVTGRLWERPSPPMNLLADLSDSAYGLPPALLSAFGTGTHSKAGVPSLPGRVRPTSAQEIFGRGLRSLRESSSVTITEAARSILASPSKISRIEAGRTRTKESDLDQLLDLYGVEERGSFRGLSARLNEENWWHPFGHLVDEGSASCFVLESVAQIIWQYEVRMVPNLLQTRAYAESVMRLRHRDEGRVRALGEMHTQRQRRLLKPGATKIWAFLEYAAVAAGIGEPGVLREQIEFLLKLTELPHVSIQVLPPGPAPQAATGNSFTLLRLRGLNLPDVVQLHLYSKTILLSHLADTDSIRLAMAQISLAAQPPRQTREILTNLLHAG